MSRAAYNEYLQFNQIISDLHDIGNATDKWTYMCGTHFSLASTMLDIANLFLP